ncbi:MAG TPA: glycosyltransferase family 4 protein [Actinomycetota bacterium]
MRIAVAHPQTPFVHGGAETHTETVVAALKAAGHEAEEVVVAGKWYPATELVHQMAVWRSLDLSESNGLPIDMVIALKFPAYLVPHSRKVVWLIHQHRSAYELWDHPDFADLSKQVEGPAVRDMVQQSDRVALSEAKRIFTNSRNVQERLWSSHRLTSEVLYHPSPLVEALLPRTPGPYGDAIVFPSRLEALKRQPLVIDAMRHVRTEVRLVLVGGGPDEPVLRDQIDKHRLQDRVTLTGRVPDAELQDLYLNALGVYYGPFDEDYGYVTIEGFAAHRPVVTLTDAGGPLEFVSDEVTGLVTPPEPQAIAHAFDRLFSNRPLARSLGEAGNALIRDRVPGWPDIVARLIG